MNRIRERARPRNRRIRRHDHGDVPRRVVPVFYVVLQGWSDRRAVRRLDVARPAHSSVAD